jgi:peptide/nickel transport system permease protein
MAVATARPQEIEVIPSRWTRTWKAIGKFIMTKPLGAMGGVIILVMIFAAAFAPQIAPYDPYELNQSLQFGPPSLSHPFGTD